MANVMWQRRLLLGLQRETTGLDSALLIKKAGNFLFVVTVRTALAPFSFKPSKFFSESSIFTQQFLLIPMELSIFSTHFPAFFPFLL